MGTLARKGLLVEKRMERVNVIYEGKEGGKGLMEKERNRRRNRTKSIP